MAPSSLLGGRIEKLGKGNDRVPLSSGTQRELRRASIHTLGCRLNQAESQSIQEQLTREGYHIVPFGDEAELGIINTCTVTREADAKSRQAIRRFLRRNPKAFTAVIGCYSQMGAKAIAEISGVDLIIGSGEKLNVLDFVKFGKSDRPLILRERINRRNFTIEISGENPYPKRANLKVQDGCDFMCTFCVIPAARGRARSREFKNIVEQARNLAVRGVREIVLTGVNIGTYRDQERDILSIIDTLDGITNVKRIRLSSIEPTTVPLELLERMADRAHALTPYLHIPLQSGSDRILEKMRRRYSVGEFTGFINRAYSVVPDLCIGTDLMVGFPGETKADFEETCEVFQDNPFAYCHVFTYSERSGTAAVRMNCPVPVAERRARSARLRKLSAQRRRAFYERFLGATLEVLFEDVREGAWPGYTGNYIQVRCSSIRDLRNRRALVNLEHLAADFVEGQVVAHLD